MVKRRRPTASDLTHSLTDTPTVVGSRQALWVCRHKEFALGARWDAKFAQIEPQGVAAQSLSVPIPIAARRLRNKECDSPRPRAIDPRPRCPALSMPNRDENTESQSSQSRNRCQGAPGSVPFAQTDLARMIQSRRCHDCEDIRRRCESTTNCGDDPI